jgi:phosphoribosylglycinamide formyltransferase-1
MLAIAILASGAGSNFEAIAEAIAAGSLDADIRLLICNRPRAAVLEKAARRDMESVVIDHRDFASREEFDAKVVEHIKHSGAQLVVMAGFDRVVTKVLIDAFPCRLINIHPSLLPAFRGSNAQRQAADYGVTVTGATVHLVDEEVDHGPIIVQAAVPVIPGEDAEAIRKRILVQEHRIYPWAIQLFAEGRIEVEGAKVRISTKAQSRDQVLISPPLD